MPDQDQAGVWSRLISLFRAFLRLVAGKSYLSTKQRAFKGLWALPGGHLNRKMFVRSGAQREAQEETGLAIPLSLFEQVYTFEDFQDPRG